MCLYQNAGEREDRKCRYRGTFCKTQRRCPPLESRWRAADLDRSDAGELLGDGSPVTFQLSGQGLDGPAVRVCARVGVSAGCRWYVCLGSLASHRSGCASFVFGGGQEGPDSSTVNRLTLLAGCRLRRRFWGLALVSAPLRCLKRNLRVFLGFGFSSQAEGREFATMQPQVLGQLCWPARPFSRSNS